MKTNPMHTFTSFTFLWIRTTVYLNTYFEYIVTDSLRLAADLMFENNPRLLHLKQPSINNLGAPSEILMLIHLGCQLGWLLRGNAHIYLLLFMWSIHFCSSLSKDNICSLKEKINITVDNVVKTNELQHWEYLPLVAKEVREKHAELYQEQSQENECRVVFFSR